MTTIQITEDVRITTDAVCTSIERRTFVKKGDRAGEECWASVGFYASLVQAAKALVGRHLHLMVPANSASGVSELHRFIDAVEKAEKAISVALSKPSQETP